MDNWPVVKVVENWWLRLRRSVWDRREKIRSVEETEVRDNIRD